MDDGQQWPLDRERPSDLQRTLEQQQRDLDPQERARVWERERAARRLDESRNQPRGLQDPIEDRWQWRRWLGLDRRDAPERARPEPRQPGGRKPGGRRR